MAKSIEIAFTHIRLHKAFRNLKALERGIFLSLVQAALLDEIDPLPLTAPRTLAMLAGATSMQWVKGGPGALKAVAELLPLLRERYQATTLTRQKRAKGARAALQESWNRKRLAKQARLNAKLSVNNFLQDQAVAPVILQPTKATGFRPETIDMHARKAVQLAKSDKLGIKRFTD